MRQIEVSPHENGTKEKHEKRGLLRSLAHWIEKQNIDPKTWIIIMFIVIFVSVIFNITWMFVSPKEVVIKEVPAAAIKTPQLQGITPSHDDQSVEYKEIAERAQKARMILNSGVPLTKSDSLFISDTYDMITKFSNKKLP